MKTRVIKPNFFLNPMIMIVIIVGISLCSCSNENLKLTVQLHQPNQNAIEIGQFNFSDRMPIHLKKEVDNIQVEVTIENLQDLLIFNVKARSEINKKCFLSLKASYRNGTAYTYNGPEETSKILRQSPHDPKNHVFPHLVKQAIPMVALNDGESFFVAVSNTPALYDNFTTQVLDNEKKFVSINSGDTGMPGGSDTSKITIESHYHDIGIGKSHTFDGILFKSAANDLSNLRKDVLTSIAKRWGNNITDRFGATAFGSNYMLIRKNETGNSKYWVVPAIEYANKQYSRDAFWQSMVLPPEYSRECYLNEAVAQSTGAERPLFCMIWAYRTKIEGGQPDMEAAEKTLAYIEKHAVDGWFHSSDKKERKNFQSWKDLAAFEETDVISYNQGLLAVALMSAEALGLKPSVSSEKAIKNYQSLFNIVGGYFPLSKEKDMLSVDPLVGDLLSQLYFKKVLLSDESVISHYNNVVSKAKTAYGFKVSCLPNGDYAPLDWYSVPGHDLGKQEIGNYQFGGSWFLYDMLFLIDSYLHNAPGALDEIKWRGSLDFKLGGTYFEYINTINGKPNKANQGWDAAVYFIWRKLIDQGKADNSFFDEIDNIKP